MELAYVDSSTVDQVGYDEEQLELHVIFKSGGRHYIYSDIPENVYQDFINSPSKGQFVHEVLKGHGYPCRRA
jgi:hypothetical protein